MNITINNANLQYAVSQSSQVLSLTGSDLVDGKYLKSTGKTYNTASNNAVIEITSLNGADTLSFKTHAGSTSVFSYALIAFYSSSNMNDVVSVALVSDIFEESEAKSWKEVTDYAVPLGATHFAISVLGASKQDSEGQFYVTGYATT